MKRLLFVSLMIVTLTSCEFYLVDQSNDNRVRIIGSHDMDEYSETFNDHTGYSIYIGRGSYSNEIYIDNFYAANIRVYATVSYDKIDIYRQTVNGYEVEGVGTIYSNEIHFNYRVKDLVTGAKTDYCEATAWKY